MTANSLLKEGERIDELQRNGYGIIQDPARFCFGMDAVLLAGFATAKKGERVLDLGTGTGIIPILMEAKTCGESFTGLEIQEESADMARRSVSYNHLEEKVKIVTGDIKDASNIFYCCRKTVINDKGEKEVKFLTYVGPHPLMDTGTRDILLQKGDFVEDFNYDKWQKLVKAGRLDAANVLTTEEDSKKENNDSENAD